jgi:alkanesulfonate monooxygenase SsuD/methylene tetrahydromethanopterin reductase-like flavin-dependent oxidoreductase (luciferase family)
MEFKRVPLSSPLTFGFIYDLRNPVRWRRPWAEHYAETLDFIAWSETAGFTGAWIPEHHLAEDGYIPSPIAVLGAIAARTSTIRLGTGVALAPLHHPVRFAEEMALLQILSNGRLEVQLAIGYRSREAAMFGVDFRRRGRIFDEFLEIVTRLWAGENVTFEGDHFSVLDAKLMPPPTAPIPLYIGGFAEKALERVAKFGDGYFGDPRSSKFYQEKLRAMDKDPSSARIRIPCLFTVVAHDTAVALEELAPFFHHVNNSYGEWNHEDKAASDGPPISAMSLDEFIASGALEILTPGQAIDKFKALQGRLPLDHVMLALPAGARPAEFKKYARIFAEEVIPAFA